MNLKNSGDSTGFEPMTSAMPVQCSHQLSYEVTQWRAGQFVGLMLFPVKGMSYERMLYAVRCMKSNEDMIIASVGESTAPASQRSWVRIPLSHLNFSGS